MAIDPIEKATIKWLYPPNFTGTYAEGRKDGHRRHVVLCTRLIDSTVIREDDSIKLKRTDMLTSAGNIPSFLVIEKIWYKISGVTVKISYNNENDEEVVTLYDGEGDIDFTPHGGFMPVREDVDEVPDGGDIVFSTTNETDTDHYTIILTVRLKD